MVKYVSITINRPRVKPEGRGKQLTDDQVAYIYEKADEGCTAIEIARKFFRMYGRDISPNTVRGRLTSRPPQVN